MSPHVMYPLLPKGIWVILYQTYTDPSTTEHKTGYFFEGLLLYRDKTKYFLSVAHNSLVRCMHSTDI